ncbi:DMT family transporter [Acidiferrobacter sp.]|uniref:DMT family transporter n=1 Tax=Acidiferrobacter sp. TaxID=1872107 RepID=UPI00262447B0|nr:DMT family transporter [Acidiferrobacter sp.]
MPTKHHDLPVSPIFTLLLSQAIFGAWGVVAHQVRLAALALIFVMAASGYLFARAFLTGHRLSVPARSLWVGLNLFLDIFLLIYAYRRAPLALVITIHYLGPMIVQFVAPFALGERPRRLQVVLAGFGFIGGALVAGPRWNGHDAAGLLAALGSALTLAGNIILQKRRMLHTDNPMAAVSEYNIVLAIVAGCAMLLSGQILAPFTHGLRVLLYAALAGILVQGIAMFLFNYSLTAMRGAVVAIVSSTEIIFASLFGFFLYGQTLTPIQIVGIAVVASVVVALKFAEAP